MSELYSPFLGPAGPSGSSGAIYSSASNSISILALLGYSTSIALDDIYSDGFLTPEGIDPSSILFYNKSLGCVEVPKTDTTKSFDFSFLSSSGWITRDLKGNIWKWVSDGSSVGHFEGVTKQLIGSVINKGSGKVGFVCPSHGYSSGVKLEVRNSSYYDGTYTVDAITTLNEIVVSATYVPETFSSSVVVNQRIKLGSSGDSTRVEKGTVVQFNDESIIIKSISGTGSESQAVTLLSDHVNAEVLSISGIYLESGLLKIPNYVSDYVRSFTTISYTSGPTARSWAQFVYDPVGKQAFLFGGSGVSGALNDLWKFDVITDSWSQLNPTGGPPAARARYSMVLDSYNRTLLVFGGLSSNNYNNRNDLWKYNIAANTWTELSPTGGPPAVRSEHSAVYDSINRYMYVFGGYNSTGVFSECWKYDIAGNAWSALAALPATRRGLAGVYDPVTKQVLQSCGSFYGNELNHYYIYLNVWLARYSYTGVVGRVYHTMNFNPFDRTLILYGGNNSAYGDLQIIEFNIDTNRVSDFVSYLTGYREAHAAAFDLENNRLLVFGGNSLFDGFASPTMLAYRMKEIIYPKAINVAYSTDKNHLVCKSAGDIYSVSISQSPLDQTLYFAVSFDNKTTWKIFTSSRTWRDIVRNNSGTWQFKNGSDAWENSSDQTSALESAFAVATNQWSSLVSSDPWLSSYATDKLPAMTTNTAPSPAVASASTEYSGSYLACKAFANDGNSSYWCTGNGAVTNQYVQIDMGSGNAFYPLKWRWMNSSNTYQPKRFKLQGSNNGSSWTDLDTRYENADCPLVGNGAWSSYVALPTTTAYRYYRMYIMSGYSATYIYVAEIEIIDYNTASPAFNSFMVSGPVSLTSSEWKTSGGFTPGTATTFDLAVGMAGSYVGAPYLSNFTVNYATAASNMTYISKSWEASQINPKSAFCLLDVETVESLVLDTDLKVWVSMDDGANYEQITGLSILLTAGNHYIITGNKPNLTARNDQTMRLKVTTHNNKEVRLHGASCGVQYI